MRLVQLIIKLCLNVFFCNYFFSKFQKFEEIFFFFYKFYYILQNKIEKYEIIFNNNNLPVSKFFAPFLLLSLYITSYCFSRWCFYM